MRHVFGGGFRRRLVLVFVTVAGFSAGAVAVGTFVVVRSDRMTAFVRRVTDSTWLGRVIVQREQDPVDLTELVRASGKSGGFDTVVAAGDRTLLSSSPSLDVSDIPQGIRAAAAREEDGVPQPATIGGVPYLVVGERTAEPGGTVYFLFSQRRLMDEMDALGRLLGGLWLLVVVVAALVGDRVARRTLLPVREAAAAAQHLAEGLLETRLPVRGEDEFGAWASCFNQMADALGETITALHRARELERRFTADVAHELRTPVGSMVAAASILEEDLDGLPAEARRPAELVIGGARRLRSLVLDLLELYSLDQGSHEMRIERFRADASLAELVELCGWQGRLRLDLAPVWVVTDRRRFDRVTSNVIGNAVEHGGEQVCVELSEDGPFVVLHVTDDGEGIPPEDLPQVFGRFYKADPARRAGGPGLGLAIAWENARLLNGTLEAESIPGAGTTFVLRLPAPPPDRTGAPRTETAGEAGEATGPDGERRDGAVPA